MQQVTVHTTISAPRELVFDFVADLAGRPAYTDHYLEDYRLARANPYGLGAGARFKIRGEWTGIRITECDRPRRIVEEAGVGRRGRSRGLAVYDFIPEAGGSTRVELTTYSEPATLIDRFKQRRAHRWVKRQTKMALERLRLVFEEPPSKPLKRATVAGYEPAKAPRFGAPTGTDPTRRPRPGYGPAVGAHRELKPPALAAPAGEPEAHEAEG
jgi:uncharacterized protein YndB with AHSA1/START domain